MQVEITVVSVKEASQRLVKQKREEWNWMVWLHRMA